MYLGPEIQCSCRPQRSLVKKHNYQTFETTGTGAYPPAMDLALATAFVTAIRATAALPSCQSGREQGEEASEAKEVEVPAAGSEATVGPDTCQSDRCCSGSPVVSDRLQEVSGNAPGVGRAMRAYYKGKHRSVHDGGGLCSPGRWPPSRRKPLEGINGLKLTAKVKKLFLSWVLEVEKRNKGGVKDLTSSGNWLEENAPPPRSEKAWRGWERSLIQSLRLWASRPGGRVETGALRFTSGGWSPCWRQCKTRT